MPTGAAARRGGLTDTVWQTIALDQAIALIIALVIVASNAPWWPALLVATTFSQCIGLLCHAVSPPVALRWPDRRALALTSFFTCGVVGAEIARRLLRLMGYETGPSLVSLAIGASVAVAVGLVSMRVRRLRANLDAAEQALRARELAEAQLRQAKTEAELASLRSRINPHFLFNTLNSIAALVREDPSRAETVIWQLSSLFRYALQANKQAVVSLAEEIEIVRRYLEIEQVRLGDRLNFQIDVEDGLGDALVPALVLQPLVENAIKHGVSARPGPGAVRVRGWRDGGDTLLSVWDSGGATESTGGTGEGLENVRQRLRTLFGERASVELKRSPNATETLVRLPAA